jgi:hypothetical protein
MQTRRPDAQGRTCQIARWGGGLVILAAVTLGGCGGGSSAPTAPDATDSALCTVPSQPALRASVNGASVTVSWDAPANTSVVDYLLEVGRTPGASDADVRTVPSTSFTLTSVPAGTYYARVKARNSCGAGPASPEVAVVVGGAALPNQVSLYGGRNYDTYLGCFDCNESAANSIHNPLGAYGSRSSSTSIWNHSSDYGSQSSAISACNEFASNPPRLFDSRGAFLGELTLIQFRSDAIRDQQVVRWLRVTVCER